MISWLSGRVAELEFTRSVIDVQGVGYEVFIPMSTFDQMAPLGETVQLYIQMVVREDAMTLYGFKTTDEKALFLLLNSVSGIGPKLALNVLSALPVGQVCQLIESANTTALSKINGLGKKTAERLVVELKDKVGGLGAATSAPARLEQGGLANVADGEVEDAIGALCTLGFKEASARKAVQQLADKSEDKLSAESLIRMALQKLNS